MPDPYEWEKALDSDLVVAYRLAQKLGSALPAAGVLAPGDSLSPHLVVEGDKVIVAAGDWPSRALQAGRPEATADAVAWAYFECAEKGDLVQVTVKSGEQLLASKEYSRPR